MFDEIDTSTETEITPVETTPIEETPAAAPAETDPPAAEVEDEENHPGAEDDKTNEEKIKAEKAGVKPGDPAAQAAGGKAAFVPDYKVTVYGKQREIPEKFRSLMTDESSSKEVREFCEKALALDEYKPKQEAASQKIEHYEKKVLPAYAKQDAIIRELTHHIKHNDFDSYFEALGVPFERVAKWMEQRLSLTPEQAVLYNQNRELQKNTYKLEIENSQFKSSSEQAIADVERQQGLAMIQELDFNLTRGDIGDRVKAYDEKNGANSLRNLVIKHGHYAANVEGRKLSNEEAIKEVLERVAPAIAAPNTNSGPIPKTVAPKVQPTLPVVRTRPQSPTVKTPSSINDIRKKSAAMGATQFPDE